MHPTITFNLMPPSTSNNTTSVHNNQPQKMLQYLPQVPVSSGGQQQILPLQSLHQNHNHNMGMNVMNVNINNQAPGKYICNYVIDYNREIGHGNFSHVYVAIDQRQPNIKMAVKVVNI